LCTPPRAPPLCPCFLPLLPALRPLHSFPTRRSSDLLLRHAPDDVDPEPAVLEPLLRHPLRNARDHEGRTDAHGSALSVVGVRVQDRKSTRLNSSHGSISYAVFCLQTKSRDEDVVGGG